MSEEILSEFLTALDAGDFDEKIVDIMAYIENRREILREDLRKRVKELFGDDADIRLASESQAIQVEPKEKENPFIQKAQENSDNGGPQTPPGLPPDPASDLDALDAQMHAEAQSDPNALRGAAISGVHSSQIWGGQI